MYIRQLKQVTADELLNSRHGKLVAARFAQPLTESANTSVC